jgi:hypothetical protein
MAPMIIALTLIASSLQADMPPAAVAPAGTPDTRYCLRVDPVIGSRIGTIECLTRNEWALLEIDVDQEWAENGVKVIA